MKVKIKNRVAEVEILEQKDNIYRVKVDDVEYNVDIEKVEEGVYSILKKNESTNMEMIVADKPNIYHVNTRSNTYTVEILDAKSRLSATSLEGFSSNENFITSPMPGKVVKIMTQTGSQVAKGDTLIVVSAMKMESEYKSHLDGTIKQIFIKEGDTVDGNQKMIEITPSIKE